jgi:hypothetical protein
VFDVVNTTLSLFGAYSKAKKADEEWAILGGKGTPSMDRLRDDLAELTRSIRAIEKREARRRGFLSWLFS